MLRVDGAPCVSIGAVEVSPVTRSVSGEPDSTVWRLTASILLRVYSIAISWDLEVEETQWTFAESGNQIHEILAVS